MENFNSDQEVNNNETGNVIQMDNETNSDITLGQFLKQAREEKSLSLDAISRHTKINSTSLNALENDDISNLPNIAYVKGFVKSYAKIVSKDEKYALQLLEKLYYGDAPQEILEEQPQEEEAVIQNIEPTAKASKESKKGSPIVLVAAVSIIAVGSLIFLLSKNTTSDNKEENIIVKPQVVTAQTPLTNQKKEVEVAKQVDEVKEEPTPVIAKKVEEKKEVKVKKVEEVKKDEPKKVETKKEVKSEEKKLVSKEEKKEEKKEEIKFSVLPSPLFGIKDATTEEIKELIPDNYYNSVEAGKQNVFIRATSGDTWLTYKVDDEPIKKYILKKGRYALFKGDDIRVFLGNVHVTKVFLNNEMLDIQSRSGVKSLVFPKEKAKDLRLPLFIFQKSGKVITSEEYINSQKED